MPTQEERLAILEQAATASQKFQQQAAAHIQETEENTTILLGVIRSQGRDIKRTTEHLETIDTKLENLSTINERLDSIEALLAQILTHLPQTP